ncbi:hypothetical protein J5500_03375 [Candidatus Saccharibacteria bacterium]|nr:hypothetical protein [Candidatus Saccharibacteria bacterium]
MSKKQFDSACIALICFALMGLIILGVVIKSLFEPKPDIVANDPPAASENVETAPAH